MNIRSRQLAQRRGQLVALIGSQRNQLSDDCQSFRAPLRKIDHGIELAMYARQYFPAFSIGIAVLSVFRKRPGALSMQRDRSWGKRMGLWWRMGKVAFSILPRLTGWFK